MKHIIPILLSALLLTSCAATYAESPPSEPEVIYADESTRSGVTENDNCITYTQVNNGFVLISTYYLSNNVCSEYSLQLELYGYNSPSEISSIPEADWNNNNGVWETPHIQLEEVSSRQDILKLCYIALALSERSCFYEQEVCMASWCCCRIHCTLYDRV